MYMMDRQYIEYLIVFVPLPVICKYLELRLMRGMSMHGTFGLSCSSTGVDNQSIILGIILGKLKLRIYFLLLPIYDNQWQLRFDPPQSLNLVHVLWLSDDQVGSRVLCEVFNLSDCGFDTQWN